MPFAAAIFLAAFLLFDLEPLISKHLLPFFGGAAAVWTVALVVFQVLLLAGYGWAHWLSAYPARRQARLQLTLWGFSLLWIGGQAVFWPAPFMVPVASGAQRPLLALVLALLVSIGPVFLLLASSSPLLQRWYSLLAPGRTPFVLYAFSNAGSLVALLAFSLFLERWFTLTEHAWLWSGIYLLLAGLMVFFSRRLCRLEGPSIQPAQDEAEKKIGARQYLPWLALSAQGTLLLVAVSNKITQDLAAVPLLWLAPLGLYLLSFMVAFSGRWQDRRRLLGWLYLLFSLLSSFSLLTSAAERVVFLIVIYCGLLMVGTLYVHGELYRLRPTAERLTAFYLATALGGALGGLMGSLLAPALLPGYFELDLALLLGVGAVFWREHERASGRLLGLRQVARVTAALVVVAALALNFLSWRRGLVFVDRNFYGSVKVSRFTIAGRPSYWLIHGRTCHGLQLEEESLRHLTTTYYTPESGVGLALTRHPRRLVGEPLRVGLVGLGIGTLAAYGQQGDRFVFYEINPLVAELARCRYFSYLSDSAAEILVKLGDGRLLLEEELAAGQGGDYDLLVIDAFSSDSVPVHLLTREAFAVYLRRLAPGGVLALHASNKYLAVEKAAVSGALAAGLPTLLLERVRESDFAFASQWVLAGRDENFLRGLSPEAKFFRPGDSPPIRPWEDRFSNILDIVEF